jgi:RimJ/RimL family protein N-acetyltransferase
MDDIAIRPARIDDAQALIDYLAQLRAEGLETLFHRARLPTLTEEQAWVRSLVQSPGSHLLLATRGDVVVGLVDVRRRSHVQLAHSVVLGVSVLREHRGRGIGRALFRALFEALATTPEIERVELEVLGNNPRAITLYERLDFVHEGRKRGAVRVGDERVDIVQMAWRRPAAASSSPSVFDGSAGPVG